MWLLSLWKAIHSYQISPFLLTLTNMLYTESISYQIPQQQGTLQVAATSLCEPSNHPSPNVHNPLDYLHNSFCTFQILPTILPTKEMKHTSFTTTIKYNMHHWQQKPLNVYVNALSTEHNCRLCTVPLWQETQMVYHLVRHTTRIPSSITDWLTVRQFN